MQELSVLLTLAAVFAIALVSPGPDVALVVRTSLHQGRRAGLASALGLACGILLHTTLVLTGVSLLLSRTPVLFAILQALGALYLAWLGVGALQAGAQRAAAEPGQLGRPDGPQAGEEHNTKPQQQRNDGEHQGGMLDDHKRQRQRAGQAGPA
ncbi:LysE family translocator, partial [Pseudomonas aeruginosa]|uniref:LysE family translocator n=1 Tax=Pseudomonas aeruginosa TaxID=287 RepID=UPI0020B116EE